MKQHIFPALRLTLICVVFFVGIYPLLVWCIAQAASGKGEGETISFKNKIVGYKLEGQKFTGDKYFNSRPSAVDYDAAGSGGSNKGPSNPAYLKQVQDRIDTFMLHNPGVSNEKIPSELITASGSGLDPDLSPQGAYVQVMRIAKIRNLPEERIRNLVASQIQKPLLSLFGPEKINVLKTNIELDKLK